MSDRVQTNPVLAAYFDNTKYVDQATRDFLTKKHGVPNLALGFDSDGACSVLGMAQVIFDGRFFDFAREGEDGACRAVVIVARDEGGDPIDLVAWSERREIIATLFGRATVLGAEQILAPQLGDPPVVHRTILGWLQSSREGLVIVDAARAWRALEGTAVVAEDVKHGGALHKALTPPAPRILVRETQQLKVAA